MADLTKTREAPIQQFWDITEDVHAGMLGVDQGGQHMQPMHPNCDRDGRAIWFYVKRSSDLAGAVGSGSKAHFCVVGRGHDYHASVAGVLTVDPDPAMIDRFWGPMTQAWFTGKDDPELTMLKLTLEDGVAWASANSIAFGWEMLKAAMSAHKDPDVGVRQHFTFVHAMPAHAAAQATPKMRVDQQPPRPHSENLATTAASSNGREPSPPGATPQPQSDDARAVPRQDGQV